MGHPALRGRRPAPPSCEPRSSQIMPMVPRASASGCDGTPFAEQPGWSPRSRLVEPERRRARARAPARALGEHAEQDVLGSDVVVLQRGGPLSWASLTICQSPEMPVNVHRHPCPRGTGERNTFRTACLLTPSEPAICRHDQPCSRALSTWRSATAGRGVEGTRRAKPTAGSLLLAWFASFVVSLTGSTYIDAPTGVNPC